MPKWNKLTRYPSGKKIPKRIRRKFSAEIAHLKKDRKTWLSLSKKAREEARSDERLIKKLK